MECDRAAIAFFVLVLVLSEAALLLGTRVDGLKRISRFRSDDFGLLIFEVRSLSGNARNRQLRGRTPKTDGLGVMISDC